MYGFGGTNRAKDHAGSIARYRGFSYVLENQAENDPKQVEQRDMADQPGPNRPSAAVA